MLALAQADDDPFAPRLLNSIGDIFWKRYETGYLSNDLRGAISNYDRSVRLTPDFDPEQGTRLANLGLAMIAQSRCTGNVSDIDTACLCFEGSLLNEPCAQGVRACKLMVQLGGALLKRLEHKGCLSDLARSVSILQQAVEFTPVDDPDKPVCLTNLAIALKTRFDRLGAMGDLEEAISVGRKAVELIPYGHPSRHICLSHLGVALRKRFDRLGAVEDLDDSISVARQAVELTPGGHPDRPACLTNLGIAFQGRFGHLGAVDDLEEAISVSRQAVDLTPDDYSQKLNYLTNLGHALQMRFDSLGDVSDLEAVISVSQQAIDLNPNGHPGMSNCLDNLGNAFHSRFDRLGDVSALEEAISVKRQAMELTPNGHHEMPRRLNNLGNALATRFDRLGDISDLEAAISFNYRAVELTTDGHIDKPNWLNNLGSDLQTRFDRLGVVSDLEMAISVKRKAVELTPNGHTGKARRLNNLGNALQKRFLCLGDVSDLTEAISLNQQAVDLTPDAHPGILLLLNNLGTVFHSRFVRLRDVSDLESAIAALERAVELTPDGHPGKPVWLWNLTRSLLQRCGYHRNFSDFEAAMNTISTAAQFIPGLPLTRFNAAKRWSELSEMVKDERQTMCAYDCAIGLISRVAWMGLPIEGRHHELERIGGLVRKAAAAAVRCGELDRALQWLEQGRSVVWGQSLQQRSPLDLLKDVDPVRAGRLKKISSALEANAKDTMSYESRGKDLRTLALEWDALLLEVRKLEGFEDFLGPKKVEQLLSAASSFPIVVLNAYEAGCDALVLLADPEAVIHIPLDFNSQKAQGILKALERVQTGRSLERHTDVVERHLEKRAPARIDPDLRIKLVLAELWDKVVKPVIDGLAFSLPENATDDLPRICWCPTGPLAFLPLHAAGLYDSASPGTKVFDYVVSSYTPTITALLQAHPASSSRPKILAIAQSTTKGQSPLPNVVREVELLREKAMTNAVDIVVTSDKSGTVRHILEEMGKYPWIHFASHGTQDLDNPTKSAFHLSDGKLELSEIVKHPLPHAEFAFLSACETATGVEKLSEEAVNLAAGLMLAGYRSIVATTWSIRDQDGPVVAGAVYAEMLKDGKADYTRAAHGLHRAVQKLRTSGAPFLAWMSFIHMGM